MDLLIESCDVIASGPDMSAQTRGDILIQDGAISQIGPSLNAPPGTARLDGRGCVVIPGLVNTHHHMFQTMTRAWGHDLELFDWLAALWPRWAAHDAEWQYAATMVAGAELLLSGCTTTVDHHYLPPTTGEDPIHAQAEAAISLGIRIVQAIGSMNISDLDGGLAPAELCESSEAFLARAERLIASGHDSRASSRRRIALAPCHPLAVTQDHARATVDLARTHDIRLHTHVAEARGEEAATLAATGLRPVELLESWGLLGTDVWLAHAVHLDDADVKALTRTGTSVATCPSSNLRLGSGIARIRDLLDAEVAVSLGVDGSASNDSGNILHEARQLMLASRAHGVQHGIRVHEALTIATSGGAAALGWPQIGSLGPGQRADLAMFDLNTLAAVGTEDDPVAGLLLSPPSGARHVIVEGDIVVREGRLVRADADEIRERATATIQRMRRASR